MQVEIKYNDNQSFTVEEVIAQAKRNYGTGASVKILPDSTRPTDLVAFAISIWITEEQISYWYDDKHTYLEKMKKLKSELMYRFGETIDSVIKDNENKLTGD
jgi:hypothetical protein